MIAQKLQCLGRLLWLAVVVSAGGFLIVYESMVIVSHLQAQAAASEIVNADADKKLSLDPAQSLVLSSDFMSQLVLHNVAQDLVRLYDVPSVYLYQSNFNARDPGGRFRVYRIASGATCEAMQQLQISAVDISLMRNVDSMNRCIYRAPELPEHREVAIDVKLRSQQGRLWTVRSYDIVIDSKSGSPIRRSAQSQGSLAWLPIPSLRCQSQNEFDAHGKCRWVFAPYDNSADDHDNVALVIADALQLKRVSPAGARAAVSDTIPAYIPRRHVEASQSVNVP